MGSYASPHEVTLGRISALEDSRDEMKNSIDILYRFMQDTNPELLNKIIENNQLEGEENRE